MLDIIHLLPDSVANQIAAGEVIQRPASVVKELVENSIDAGATSVQIIIKDAGRTLIQVIDNGCGMSVTDARMAFERHATSKIDKASDLYSLHTMGFRGEALPSIAAVSEIEMRTMRRDDNAGTRIAISASHVQSQIPDLCSVGTNIMVKRLFFNLPARRKFLKKDAIELGHIVREFERLSLVNTNVEFSLVHNEVEVHRLNAAPLKQRIGELFGKSLEHQLIPIATDTTLVKIDGFVGLPANARKRGALQYFFVNGRYMRHPYFHRAVLNCYEALIPADTQPNYFINFTVDPETIDVNIHPQKYEIKFENEQPVWQILSACIKESLGRFNASAAIDFNAIEAPDIPPMSAAPAYVAPPPAHIDAGYNPFDMPPRREHPPTDWQKLYDNFSRDTKGQSPQSASIASRLTAKPDDALPIEPQERKVPMMQIKGRYIATPAKNGLMIVDQHRAHLRILYDKYLDTAQKGPMPSQRLIFPETVTLDPTQNIVASSICETLASMGFEISYLGNSDWSINAVPPILGNANPADALTNIINTVSESDDDVEDSQWHRIALSIARSGAIKYGTSLSEAEMDRLIVDLLALPSPDYTPDGKAVICILDLEALNKLL